MPGSDDLLDLHVPHQLTVYLELQSSYVERVF